MNALLPNNKNKKMVSGDRGQSTSTIRNLWPYMWPSDRPDLKLRVVGAMAVLIVAKVITVLVYCNEKWDHPDGQLRMLRSKNDIEDYAAQVPPLGGTLLAFRRTGHSWHGHTRFVGERGMVQLNYLDASPLAVAAQRISRFGTHFMKNVLRMR